jgi:hypothetical protein
MLFVALTNFSALQDALYARLQRLRRLLPEADVLKMAISELKVCRFPYQYHHHHHPLRWTIFEGWPILEGFLPEIRKNELLITGEI